MFVISFIANMIKRHPRCLKLVHRKFKVFNDIDGKSEVKKKAVK